MITGKTVVPTVVVAMVAVLLMTVTGCGMSNKELAKMRSFLKEQQSESSCKEYRVRPPDVISVSSIHVPEINTSKLQISPDGKINLPLLGEVVVVNKTPVEIEAELKKRALEYYEETDATVRVDGYNSYRIFVFGQVSRQGPQAWTGNTTVLDVLAQALPTNLAWLSRIKVTRPNPPTRGGYLLAKQAQTPEDAGWVAEGGGKVLRIDFDDYYKKGKIQTNVFLQPDDIVYVPPTPLAEIGLAIQQVLFPINPAVEAVGTPSNFAGAAVIP